jgi:hypothetical protein
MMLTARNEDGFLFPQERRLLGVCLSTAKLQTILRKGAIDLAFVTRSEALEGKLVRREPMCWGISNTSTFKKIPAMLKAMMRHQH